jgi:hypothetical protein
LDFLTDYSIPAPEFDILVVADTKEICLEIAPQAKEVKNGPNNQGGI